jgi:hypothetical protein
MDEQELNAFETSRALSAGVECANIMAVAEMIVCVDLELPSGEVLRFQGDGYLRVTRVEKARCALPCDEV